MSQAQTAARKMARQSRQRITTTLNELIGALQSLSDDDLVVVATAARILARNGYLSRGD